MRRISTYPFRFALSGMALAVAMAAAPAWAQDQPAAPPAPGTWRHMGDQPAPQANPPAAAQPQDPEPVDRNGLQGDPNAQTANGPRRNPAPAYGLPPQLTLKPGTYINVRVNQALSSDHNKAGDTFLASLAQPVIVNGVVVAPRGQTVYGRVTEAEKPHSGQGSRLGLELTSLTLANGTQAPIHTQLVAKLGPQFPGSSAAATVVSAPAADAPAVLTNHNHASVLDPGTVLTCNVTTPVAINTANGSEAFRYAGPEDYQTNVTQVTSEPVRARPRYVYGPGYYPYYSPYYYPYYWGPSFGVGIGFGGRYGRFWR